MAFADYLAWEMGFSLITACDRPIAWYHSQLTGFRCSREDAADVRLRCIERCREVRDRRKADRAIEVYPQVVDLVGLPQIELHHFRSCNGRVFNGTDGNWGDDRISMGRAARMLAATTVIALLCLAAAFAAVGRY